MSIPIPKRALEVEQVFPVKTYDIDFAGIVSNIVYIRWLEDLRLAMLDAYYPLSKMLKAGIVPVLTQTRIDYKQPISIFEQLTGRMWCSKMKSLKLILNAEFSAAGKIIATAEQRGCLIKLSDKKPTPIPQDLYQVYLAQVGG